jgi:dihydropyrimidine dehydrogenase (NAD+) subunit PreT
MLGKAETGEGYMRTTSLITHAEAMVESRRCLDCYDAPCIQACPAGVNIPAFIRRLREENLQGAGELVYQACPLSATCGLACPTNMLCEGACVLQGLGQTPIHIGSLQSFVASQYQDPDVKADNPHPANVAVVGAGPSGLGCAIQLTRLGHHVHVFDESESIAGLADRVIPAHRLPHTVVDLDLQRINQLGIEFTLRQKIDADQARQLIETYDAVYIAVGLGGLNPFAVHGSDLLGVESAMDYLEEARKHAKGAAERAATGKIVVIIGGGNVALDAAVTAKRSGAERVIVLYRRTKEQMPGWESEYLEAAALGVEFRWLSIVEEVIGAGKGVKAVRVASMRLSETGTDGRRKVEPDPDTGTHTLPCDQVIHALGQVLDPANASAFGLELSPQGTILVDPLTQRVGLTKIFAGGECVSGGSTVVNSMSQGMKTAQAIHAWWSEKAGAV